MLFRSRFERSLALAYGRWHERLGYDLGALAELAGAERDEAQALLLTRGIVDWRDVEAFTVLDTPAARQALADAAGLNPPAVIRALWEVVAYRDGALAVACAALLVRLHGGSPRDTDTICRRFGPDDLTIRGAALKALRDQTTAHAAVPAPLSA